ncbi:hypothetical protein LTR70_004946 [Exophiala xenobiotica]|nr:hypothetical protein LTR70_004946 [Exophiala xenobiotica]
MLQPYFALTDPHVKDGYLNANYGPDTSNFAYDPSPAFDPAYAALPTGTAYQTASAQPLLPLYTDVSNASQPVHTRYGGQLRALSGTWAAIDTYLPLPSSLTPASPAAPQAQMTLSPGTIIAPGPVRKQRKKQPDKSQRPKSDKGPKPGEHTEGWTHDDWVQAGAIARPVSGVKGPGQKCHTCIWYSRACDVNLLENGKCKYCNGPPTSDKKRVCVWTVPSLGIACYPDYQKLREKVGLAGYREAVKQAFLQSVDSVTSPAVNPPPIIQANLPLVTAQPYTTGTIPQPWNSARSLPNHSAQQQTAMIPAYPQGRLPNPYQGPATPSPINVRVLQTVISAASSMVNHGLVTENEHQNLRNLYEWLSASLLQNPVFETTQINAMLSNLDDRHMRGVGLRAELLFGLARWPNA